LAQVVCSFGTLTMGIKSAPLAIRYDGPPFSPSSPAVLFYASECIFIQGRNIELRPPSFEVLKCALRDL